MAIIYKFPPGEKIHEFEEEEWVAGMVEAIDLARPKAELYFLPGMASPIIGFPSSAAEIPPQLEG